MQLPPVGVCERYYATLRESDVENMRSAHHLMLIT
jgi:hypothetical protein